MVASQLYGLLFVPFESKWFDQAIAVFLRNHFRLPNSFPVACGRAFLRLKNLRISTFEGGVSFVDRILRQPSTLVFDAFVWDRKSLFPELCGWNYDFHSRFEDLYFDEDLDLGGDISEARLAVISLCNEDQRGNLVRSPLGSLWLELSSVEGSFPMEFARMLRFLDFEECQIIFLFFSNLIRWSALLSPNRHCPLCTDSFHSNHLFLCPNATFCTVLLVDLMSSMETKDWNRCVNVIFQVLHNWVTNVTQAFRFSFSSTVRFYSSSIHCLT